MSKLAKKMGRKIKVPPINTIFQFKRNPLQDSPEVKAMCGHVFLYSLMTEEQYNKIKDICLFTAYYHPFMTDVTRFKNLARLMQLFFVLDDHNECDWGNVARGTEEATEFWKQMDECLDKLLDNTIAVSAVNWKPYIAHLHFAFEEVFRGYTEDQKKRFAKIWKEYGNGNCKEARLIKNNHRFKSLEEYLELRASSTGGKCVYQMIEYADEIHLTDYEWDEILFEYVFHGGILITLANDCQSFEKELKENDGVVERVFNCGALIMIWEECSPEEAMFKLVEIFNDYELRTKEIQMELLRRTDLSENVLKFIKSAEYIMGGNFCAGFQLERYSEVTEIIE